MALTFSAAAAPTSSFTGQGARPRSTRRSSTTACSGARRRRMATPLSTRSSLLNLTVIPRHPRSSAPSSRLLRTDRICGCTSVMAESAIPLESGVETGIEAQFYRVDNANVSAATLFTGGTNGGWTQLSSSTNGTPGFGSFNYCEGQCSYDMPVYSPPGAPNIVYIGGAYQYGELDNFNGDIHRSNGRAITRSEDAGVNFTDMTLDTRGISLHPDQHAIAATPTNPNIVFIANDGGLWRLDGSFSDVSASARRVVSAGQIWLIASTGCRRFPRRSRR